MFQEKSSTHVFALRAILAAVMIILAAVLRIVPHPWNFTPIGAMALFSGAMFRDRRVAFLFPLVALLPETSSPASIASFPSSTPASFSASGSGTGLANRRGILRVGGAVFLGALQFFLITNFAVWQLFGTYPHTPTGLAACYIAGLPFFGNAIAGDALYATLFFGTFALAEKVLSNFSSANRSTRLLIKVRRGPEACHPVCPPQEGGHPTRSGVGTPVLFTGDARRTST